jgi:DNA-binding NtrC family response regulator
MPTFLSIVQGSESFATVWADLAEAVGAEGVRIAPTAAGLAPLGESSGVILAVGGIEDRANDLLRDLITEAPPPVAVVGSEADHRLASSVVRAGASDYFALPGDLELLRDWMEARVEEARARVRAGNLMSQEAERYDFSALIGESPELQAALNRVARVIPRDRVTVLLTGETGTGKELIAQAIHYNGPRRSEPFVEVNCTALPETLLESELFGFERGSFTDARTSKPGLFEAAHRGTLLLDEIGDLSLELQVKLLKVLEDKQVRRIGAVTSIEVDVRVVAATHVDLARAVEEGRLREDLFYRLNVIPIHLPPLRDRGEDILTLADHFLKQLAEEHGVPLPRLSIGARRALFEQRWPGNIRELRNTLERATLLGGELLEPADVKPALAPATGVTSALPFPATLRAIEVAAAKEALARAGGNKSAAAYLLGISRTRLYRLLEVDRGTGE